LGLQAVRDPLFPPWNGPETRCDQDLSLGSPECWHHHLTFDGMWSVEDELGRVV
jgi:hypothetical protein